MKTNQFLKFLSICFFLFVLYDKGRSDGYKENHKAVKELQNMSMIVLDKYEEKADSLQMFYDHSKRVAFVLKKDVHIK